MRRISHVAIGVSDMDKSLPFYRDLLGLRVTLDTIENVGGLPTLFRDPQKGKRRAVYLRWEDGPEASFIVLSAPVGPSSGEPIKLDQVGIPHFSFWVNDLRARFEKLRTGGVAILVPPTVGDTVAYGEEPGGKVLTCLFQDPDGIILQFDERM
ncbi:MAG: VOC family protein [Deltaproteobacteria bacterium]|nr:VOC family protein [Deltaproteobacteria bacterium]